MHDEPFIAKFGFLFFWFFLIGTLSWQHAVPKVFLHFHLADLLATAVTFIKFHAVENVQFRYPNDTQPFNASTALVPKIMHRIDPEEWKTLHSLKYLRPTMDSCMTMHPAKRRWEHSHYNKTYATEWVATQPPPARELHLSHAPYPTRESPEVPHSSQVRRHLPRPGHHLQAAP